MHSQPKLKIPFLFSIQINTFCWLVYTLLATFAVSTRYLLHSDGAYFEFSVLTGSPWSLLWHDFSQRIAALIIPGAPSLAVTYLTQNMTLAGLTYEAIWFLIPIFGYAITFYCISFKTTKMKYQVQTLWLLGFWLLAMPTFGFPTETWVSYALVWPIALSCKDPNQPKNTQLICILLVPIVIFSHPGALLYIPFAGIAMIRSFFKQQPTKSSKFFYIALSVTTLTCLSLWVYLEFSQDFINPMNEKALNANKQHVFSLSFVRYPLFLGSVLILGCLALYRILNNKRTLTTRLIRYFLCCCVFTLLVAIIKLDTPTHHYLARSGLFILGPLILLMALYKPTTAQYLSKEIITLTLIGLIAHASMIWTWTSYTKKIYNYPSNTFRQLHTITQHDFLDWVGNDFEKRTQFFWDWSTSYTLTLLGSNLHVQQSAWYAPTTCTLAKTQIPQIIVNDMPHMQQRLKLIITEVCSKSDLNHEP